jgi:hypothetical protein
MDNILVRRGYRRSGINDKAIHGGSPLLVQTGVDAHGISTRHYMWSQDTVSWCHTQLSGDVAVQLNEASIQHQGAALLIAQETRHSAHDHADKADPTSKLSSLRCITTATG